MKIAASISTALVFIQASCAFAQEAMQDDKQCKYPIIVTNVPYQYLASEKTVSFADVLYRIKQAQPDDKTNYQAHYAYIDASGNKIKIDTTSSIVSYGSQPYNFLPLVRYQSTQEADSFLWKNDIPIELQEGKTVKRWRPANAKKDEWSLSNQKGVIVATSKKFACPGPDRPYTPDSFISDLGFGRYWVSQECASTGIGFLLNESGQILRKISPRPGTVFREGAYKSPKPGSESLSKYMPAYYDKGLLIVDGSIILDHDGNTIYDKPGYKIIRIIDNDVLLASTYYEAKKMPVAYRYMYTYINYRTGKILYTGLDYEKSGFTFPVSIK